MKIDGDYIFVNQDIRYTDVYEDKIASYVFFDIALRCDTVSHTYKFKIPRYCSERNLGEHELKHAMRLLRENGFIEFFRCNRVIIAYVMPNDDLYIISNNTPAPPNFDLLNITKNRSSEKGYSKFRNEVLKRDHCQCCKCGSRENLEVHHIKPFAKYPKLRTVVNNGETLCSKCHKSLHKGEMRSGDI